MQLPHSGWPHEFHTLHPENWVVGASDGRLLATAIAGTDFYTDPSGGVGAVSSTTLADATTLLTSVPEGDFQLRARVSVDFEATFDAGVLFLRYDDRTWAKLCFELAPNGKAMVVSVVNDGVSDDANAFVVDEAAIHLRVSRSGRVFAYHASHDGAEWVFVRAFSFPDRAGSVEVGFEAQSPHGEGCTVTFDEVSLVPSTISDLRDGS